MATRRSRGNSVKMTEKKYDIVVFGGTGFTGKYLVADVIRYASENPKFTYAIAGRNEQRVRNAIDDICGKFNLNGKNVEVIVADVADQATLNSMCRVCKVLIDCVGPYSKFGEPVVQACIDNLCDYVDISGEPMYLDGMVVKYNEAAKRNGVLLVGSCGFDSIPADIGMGFACKQFKSTGHVNRVEMVHTFDYQGDTGVNFATYESAVIGFSKAGSGELQKLRKQMPGAGVKLPIVGPKAKPSQLKWDKVLNGYVVQFPGADASVVRRSQKHLYMRNQTAPVQFLAYAHIGGLLNIVKATIAGIFLALLSRFELGRKLLCDYCSLFTWGAVTKENPVHETLIKSTFTTHFYAFGYSGTPGEGKPDREVHCTVSGPEAGYIATPIMVMESALTLLYERHLIDDQGGVLAPWAAFHGTTIISRLNDAGVKFSVVDLKQK
eukprot:Clim_evm95s236 gene=Clim_evmTU95s236